MACECGTETPDYIDNGNIINIIIIIIIAFSIIIIINISERD